MDHRRLSVCRNQAWIACGDAVIRRRRSSKVCVRAEAIFLREIFQYIENPTPVSNRMRLPTFLLLSRWSLAIPKSSESLDKVRNHNFNASNRFS